MGWELFSLAWTVLSCLPRLSIQSSWMGLAFLVGYDVPQDDAIVGVKRGVTVRERDSVIGGRLDDRSNHLCQPHTR